MNATFEEDGEVALGVRYIEKAGEKRNGLGDVG